MSKISGAGKFWRISTALIVISVVVFVALFFWRKQSTPEISYAKIKVEEGALNVTVLSTGVVEPENRLEIKPPIAGRIDEVLVDEGNEVKKGQILAWMSSTERAGVLDAARAKGPKELERWEEFYKPTPILAPIDGTIILRNVEPGQTFTNQEAVLVMSDRLTVKAQVDETDIAQIRLKQSVEINLDAYPDDKIPARVIQIAYEAKTVNNVTTYIVDVLPDKTPAYMRSGMTANVTFLVEAKSGVLIAPSEAVTMNGGKSFVLTKKADDQDKPKLQEVVVGMTDGKHVEIVSGVNQGQVLLVPQLKKLSAQSSNPFTPFGGRKGGGR